MKELKPLGFFTVTRLQRSSPLRRQFAVLVVLALLAMGMDAEASKTSKVSPEQLQAAAQTPLVQNHVAVIYAEGLGVPQDYAKAAQWFRKAAEQGDTYAQSSLAWLYAQGHGVKKDDREAANWYRKAAVGGDARSQYHLGRLYLAGKGVPKSPPKAVEWLEKSAVQGDTQARDLLRKLRRPVKVANGRTLSLEPLSDTDPAVSATANGLGVAFLQGAGATMTAEMAYFWVLAPVLGMLAL
jgi:uncharacterized protein